MFRFVSRHFKNWVCCLLALSLSLTSVSAAVIGERDSIELHVGITKSTEVEKPCRLHHSSEKMLSHVDYLDKTESMDHHLDDDQGQSLTSCELCLSWMSMTVDHICGLINTFNQSVLIPELSTHFVSGPLDGLYKPPK